MEQQVKSKGVRQVFERVLIVALLALGIAATVLFFWILIVFVNAIPLPWVKTSSVVAITLIPVSIGLGGLFGFRLGRRDTDMVLGGFWEAINKVIPQMNAHASEMSDIRITSARRLYREDPHSLAIDASVSMPPMISERVQKTREVEA